MKKIIVKSLVSASLVSASLSAEILTQTQKVINYSVSLEKPKNLQFTFSNKEKSLCQLKFSVKGTNGNILLSNKYNFKNKKDIFNIALQKGNYNLILDWGGAPRCLNTPFDFQLTKITGNFEIEPNDKISQATLMKEKSFYTGVLQSKNPKDNDYYKIIVDKDGSLRLVFKNELSKESNRIYGIELLNENKQKITLLKSSLKKKGIDKSINIKKGVYFIKVYSIHFGLENKEYNIAYVVN